MKLKKYLAKGLALGIIISNLPLYSFANNIENQYYHKLNNIETKEDVQKSAQRAMREGDNWLTTIANMNSSKNYLTSSTVNEKIYVIAGTDDSDFLTVEMYDPILNKWGLKSAFLYKKTGTSTSSVINGKIYFIGGFYNSKALNTVDVYDPVTNSWETKTSMPTARGHLTSAVINGKIYCIGGYNGSNYFNTAEVYDPATNAWDTRTSMPTVRGQLTSAVVNGKIYCIGGYNGSLYLDVVEVYDPSTDSWETKTSMPTARMRLTSSVTNGKIYCIGGYNGSNLNTVEAYMPEEPSLEYKATSSVSNVEFTKDLVDIEKARELVNQLPEGDLKTQLQARLDAIIPNITLTPLNGTSSVDTYIKTENILSMTVDTNTITFDDFSGIEDMDKPNAINVTISSSLPYQLNAYLPVEIQNSDKSKTMDKSILNIKENGEVEYKTFTNLNEKVVLKDNCIAGDDIHHGVDLKLKQGIAHEKDVYKTTIKLEIEQK